MTYRPLILPPLSFQASTGQVTTAQGNFPMTNVSVYLSPDKKVLVEGACPGLGRRPGILDFSLHATTSEGWEVDVPRCMVDVIWRPDGRIERALASQVVARRGAIRDDDRVVAYKVVTDFPFEAEKTIAGFPERVVTFTPAVLTPLTLVKAALPEIAGAAGYMVFEDSMSAVDGVWAPLFHADLYTLLSFAASNYRPQSEGG